MSIDPKRTRLRFRAMAAVALLLLSGVTLADDTAKQREVVVNRVGFTRNQFPGTATRDAEVAIDYWFKLMSDRQNFTQIPSTKVYADLDEMYAALKAKQLDIISILTHDYLAIRDEIDLEPFAIATRSQDGLTQWAVFVSRKKGIAALEALENGRVIFDTTEGDTLGKHWFDTLLMKKGFEPDGFCEAESVDKASRAILPVYFGQADACVAPMASFSTMVEMNPAVGNELVALETSPRMAPGILCFTPEIDPSRKPDIIDTLITMHKDPEGQQVLNLFRRDRVHLFEPSQILEVEKIMQEYESLTAARRGEVSAGR